MRSAEGVAVLVPPRDGLTGSTFECATRLK